MQLGLKGREAQTSFPFLFMGLINNPTGKPLDPDAQILLPSMLLPSFRLNLSIQRRTEKNLLFRTAGGLGDIVCAEPSFRYAVSHFEDSAISLVTDFPDLFRHIPFVHVYDGKKEKPLDAGYFVFHTLEDHDHLQSEFVAHPLCHCVDYVSMTMFRSQLPCADRCIKLVPDAKEKTKALSLIDPTTDVVVHPGRSWQSKTFPKDWWDTVLTYLMACGMRPVLIGNNSLYPERGTVPVNALGCLDLRDKLTLMETTAVLQTARVLLSNDSMPVHLASSGNAWIGFVSTVRHPDHIYHWRNGGEWAWRMQNLSRGGDWVNRNVAPNNLEGIAFDKVDPEKLLCWLPAPEEFASWAIQKLSPSRIH